MHEAEKEELIFVRMEMSVGGWLQWQYLDLCVPSGGRESTGLDGFGLL